MTPQTQGSVSVLVMKSPLVMRGGWPLVEGQEVKASPLLVSCLGKASGNS